LKLTRGREVRIMLRRSAVVALFCLLATSTVAAGASIKAPKSGKAGWSISVSWSGPGKNGDFIAIAPVGSSASSFFNNCWDYASDSPLTLKVPLDTGKYEVRYVTGEGASAKVLASSRLTVSGGSVAVSAPSSVAAGEDFRVDYDGPADFSDYIAITDPGAGDLDTEYGYVRTGGYDHVTIQAPDTPGSYEVRYVVDADVYAVLGATTIEVR
jgi:Ca-activated chloride channel homolog